MNWRSCGKTGNGFQINSTACPASQAPPGTQLPRGSASPHPVGHVASASDARQSLADSAVPGRAWDRELAATPCPHFLVSHKKNLCGHRRSQPIIPMSFEFMSRPRCQSTEKDLAKAAIGAILVVATRSVAVRHSGGLLRSACASAGDRQQLARGTGRSGRK